MKYLLILLVALLSACSSDSEVSPPSYRNVSNPSATSDVVVYFWYKCPHCYEAGKAMDRWAEDTGHTVEYRHSSMWPDEARVFYALKLMGRESLAHAGLMNYYRYATVPSLESIAEIAKVNVGRLSSTMRSARVSLMIQDAAKYEGRNGSTSVPFVILSDGRSLTNDSLHPGSIARSLDDLLSSEEDPVLLDP